MALDIPRIFVYGFPGQYGGAATELHHQIMIWQEMGVEVHLIPTFERFKSEPLYLEMIQRGVKVHPPHDWSMVEAGDPVLGFCNAEFLANIKSIRERTRRTVFVNCMTWLFEKEIEAMTEGLIAMFLYQNEDVRLINMPKLKKYNADERIKFMTFTPYFHHEEFTYHAERNDDYFGCGRISRLDADKFSRHTLAIYEYFVAPQWKRGFFLGFDDRSRKKIGQPFDWIQTAYDHRELSREDFYRHCRILLQPTDTTENWPRVGFEAMASGSVLIVDNRGGWKRLVEHGKTGWLCDDPRDFIYYASKMAYEPDRRDEMAAAARERGLILGGAMASRASWEAVFHTLAQLPE